MITDDTFWFVTFNTSKLQIWNDIGEWRMKLSGISSKIVWHFVWLLEPLTDSYFALQYNNGGYN